MRYAVAVLVLFMFTACTARQEPIHKRIDYPERIVGVQSYDYAQAATHSALSLSMSRDQLAQVHQQLNEALGNLGMRHEQNAPDVLVTCTREAPTKQSQQVSVAWRYHRQTGRYSYTVEADDRIPLGGALVLTALRAEDGAILRQIVLPTYFSERLEENRTGPESVPQFYKFPLGVLLGRTGRFEDEATTIQHTAEPPPMP